MTASTSRLYTITFSLHFLITLAFWGLLLGEIIREYKAKHFVASEFQWATDGLVHTVPLLLMLGESVRLCLYMRDTPITPEDQPLVEFPSLSTAKQNLGALYITFFSYGLWTWDGRLSVDATVAVLFQVPLVPLPFYTHQHERSP